MSDEKRVTCNCPENPWAVEGGEWVRHQGGTHIYVDLIYCWGCRCELSFDSQGRPVAEPMVPRAALDFAVCCELSGEPWTHEEALAAAGGGDGDGK